MSDGGSLPRRWDERHIWRAPVAVRTLWLLGFLTLFTVVPAFADRWTYDHWHNAEVYNLEWGRLFRVMGWYPTWMLAALAIWLVQRDGDRVKAKLNTWALLAGPAVAGIVCEVLKLLVRRERPEINGGDYGFRPWDDRPFSTAGLAFPSSHTMVAFAAATVLSRIFPRARWVWYLLAAGCAATRVLAHAHFLSDVMAGALLGWSAGWGAWIALRHRIAIPASTAGTRINAE